MIETRQGPVYAKEDFKGAWAEADKNIQDRSAALMAVCYVRDGVLNKDGSRGTVRMTPNELLDYLTFIISGEVRVQNEKS